MAKYTRDDILDMIEEEDIEFIRLQFTDIAGNLKNMATTVDQIDKILDGRCQFDCAAIDGFDGDMEELFLIPDLDTFVIFPWRPQHGKVARFICDIVKPDGTPFDGDSRYILKRIIAEAKDMGYDFDVALKNEFFLFDLGENGEPTQNSSEKGGYFDVGPADCGENARRDMVLYLADMGISTESSYHSDEAAQHVLDMTYTNALTMADNIMTSRLVIRTVAKRHGLHATFMPKPKKDSKGSGAHYTFSLSKNGKNIFTDADDSAGVSKEGYAFMAGILEHIADMSLVTNPLVNSYKRLVPNGEVPCYATWGSKNRSAFVRVPTYKPGKQLSRRVELRSPDPTCNPYLTMAVTLAAGMRGIAEELPLPEESSAPFSELAASGVTRLPHDLGEAVEAFAGSELMRETLGDHIFNYLLTEKREEWAEYSQTVTDWELRHYYGGF